MCVCVCEFSPCSLAEDSKVKSLNLNLLLLLLLLPTRRTNREKKEKVHDFSSQLSRRPWQLATERNRKRKKKERREGQDIMGNDFFLQGIGFVVGLPT